MSYPKHNRSVLYIACFIVFFLQVSLSNAQFRNSGIVVFSPTIWDSASNSYVRFPFRNGKDLVLYYKDSSVIEVIYKYKYKIVNNVWEKGEDSLLHYKFIDLRTRSFYEYPTFSKSSMFTKKYTLPDSFAFSGWNFYYKKGSNISNTNVLTFPDTIINGIAYKRMASSGIKEVRGQQYHNTYFVYLQCDQQGTIFHLDNVFEQAQQLDCPITMYEVYEQPTGNRMKFEVKYLDRKLTRKELRIFKAWQKNAKKYPVTGKENVDYRFL